MAEAIGTVASVLGVATSFLHTSKALYEVIDGIINAPDDIRAISDDLKGL